MFPPGKKSQLDSLGPSSKLSITTGGLCKELPSMMRSSITHTSSFLPEDIKMWRLLHIHSGSMAWGWLCNWETVNVITLLLQESKRKMEKVKQ